jgi:hypothetical protein
MDELIDRAFRWMKVKLPIAVGVWFVGMIVGAMVVDVVLVKVILVGLGWAGGKFADTLGKK